MNPILAESKSIVSKGFTHGWLRSTANAQAIVANGLRLGLLKPRERQKNNLDKVRDLFTAVNFFNGQRYADQHARALFFAIASRANTDAKEISDQFGWKVNSVHRAMARASKRLDLDPGFLAEVVEHERKL